MYENDERERILSGKCTVLCYILEYIIIYIVQKTKRHTSPLNAFNMQTLPNSLPDLYVQSKHRTYASLCYLYIIDKNVFQYLTKNSTFTRQIMLWLGE